ncbi:hypothetical protein CEXT_688081 [Caerostris extrusa]|uniref:Uncharacterized protein n=1 Tax=Caerostris extrusa TaxID=172846 RepID=A0AAV4QQP9_CAEEX|nr:hypothetical protein CEXT_688081 [Caerostris extrusa]
MELNLPRINPINPHTHLHEQSESCCCVTPVSYNYSNPRQRTHNNIRKVYGYHYPKINFARTQKLLQVRTPVLTSGDNEGQLLKRLWQRRLRQLINGH